MVGCYSNITVPFYAATPIFEGMFLMKDSDKTKEQLISELEALELEHRHTEEKLREKKCMVDSDIRVYAPL